MEAKLSPFILAFLRGSVGIVMLYHGMRGLFPVFGSDGYANSLSRLELYLNIPTQLAAFILFVQFIGGIMLILGVATRAISFFLAVVNGFSLFWKLQHTQLDNVPSMQAFFLSLLLIATCLCFMVLGGGKISLDAKFSRRKKKAE